MLSDEYLSHTMAPAITRTTQKGTDMNWNIVEPGLIELAGTRFTIRMKAPESFLFQPMWSGVPINGEVASLGYAKLVCQDRLKELHEMGVEP